MRQKLPFFDLFNWAGLYTKGSPDIVSERQLRTAINADFFETYGGVAKPPGSAQVLAAIYKEGSSAKPISWVGFYKAADLDGQILRHVIIAAGTTMQRIESDGTLTALTGSGLDVTTRTNDLIHSAVRYNDFLLVQNQDPDLIGKGDFPVKYDGAEIRRWGVIAPGTQETVAENFSSAGSFSGSAGVTISAEATTTQDGAAIKVTKDNSVQNGDVTKTITTFSVDTTIANRAFVWLYIPRSELPNFDQGTGTPAFQIYIASGADADTDGYRFDYDIAKLREGWNQVFMDFTSPDGTTGTPDPTMLNKLRLRLIAKDASTAISNVRYDAFTVYDRGTLIAAEGAAGSVFKTGVTYSYKTTFETKEGFESNAGPISVSLTTTAARGILSLSGIPVSTDNQVIKRNIYRTVGDGSLYVFAFSINNNTDTTADDETGDLSLGQISPPDAGDVNRDNSPPPQAGLVRKWKNTVFLAGMPDTPESLIFGEAGEAEAFPTLNIRTLDSKITNMYETYSALIVETEVGKWIVTGENPDFKFDKVIHNIGCVGRRAAGETRVSGWAVDREGMRLYDANNPVKISESIRDKFDNDFNKANLELLHTTHSKSRNAILMFVADSDGDYKGNNFIYQYPIDDVLRGWWWELQLPTSINPQDVEEIEDANGDFRIYFGGDDGMVYELFKAGEKNWSLNVGQGGQAIQTKVKTKFIRPADLPGPDQDFRGRILPRFLELRWDGDPCAWTVTIETATGPSQTTATATKTLTMNFASNVSLQRHAVPAMQPGEFVSITLENNESNVAGTLEACRLYYLLQPGQFVVEGDQFVSNTSC
jgi:hypothetical protein